MTVFLSWLASSIGEWWEFLGEHDVPGFSFSFAALFAFLLLLNLGIFIVRLVLHGDASGERDTVRNLKGK